MAQSLPQMSIGVSIYKLGYHRGAWRMADFPRDSMMTFDAFAKAATDAERAKLDFVFFADIMAAENIEDPDRDAALEHFVVKLDPIVALSAISSLTRNIGLISTISTTYGNPYGIARTIASLDVVSGGRAGWNIVTSYSRDEMLNFGLTSPPDAEARYARAHEAVDIVRALWDSWEEGAFVTDKARGVYLDRGKMRILNHKGHYFSVKGPLDIARSPQGLPVIVSAGDSNAAQELAAKYANVQYAPTQGDLPAAQKYYRAVKARMARYGRSENDLRILPGIMPIVGETDDEALRKRDHIRSLIHPRNGVGMLAPLFGDLSGLSLDEPLPRSVEPDGVKLGGYAKQIFDQAIAGKLTIKQTYELVGDGEPWFMTRTGSATRIADIMEEWFLTEAADGFNILPHYMPGGLDDFLRLVLPELRRRGLFRTEYPGKTLRDTLGLPAPRTRSWQVA